MGHIFQPSYHGYQASPRSVGQALPISITGGGGSGPYSSAVAAAIENLQNELRVHEYEQALKTLQDSRSRGRALVKDQLQRSTAAAALSARGMSHYPPSVPYQQQGIDRTPQWVSAMIARNRLTASRSAAAGELSQKVTVKPKQKRRRVSDPFPVRLHRLLIAMESEGTTDIVSFTPSGKAFQVHKPVAFVRDIVPNYFRQKQFKSFKRQLNVYGFDRVIGTDGAFYHAQFHRGEPDLCKDMLPRGTDV
jgi:hypothetical protein